MASLETRKAELLKNDPATFAAQVMHFILNGGRFSETDFIRFTGFGGKSLSPYALNANRGRYDFNKAKQRQYIHPTGQSFDTFILSWNNAFDHDNIEESEAVNIIADVLSNYTREEMINELEKSNPASIDESYPAAWDQHYTSTAPLLPEDIFVLQYSEKSFVVYGKTFPVKDALKLAGGRFNPFLTHPETKDNIKGWVFPISKKSIVMQRLTA